VSETSRFRPLDVPRSGRSALATADAVFIAADTTVDDDDCVDLHLLFEELAERAARLLAADVPVVVASQVRRRHGNGAACGAHERDSRRKLAACDMLGHSPRCGPLIRNTSTVKW